MPAKGKLPKWALPVGAAVIIGGVIVLRKRKANQGQATEPGAEGLSNQSFIPVTGENVAGVGAGNYGGTGENNNAFLAELLKGNAEQQREQSKQFQEYMRENNLQTQTGQEAERNFLRELLANLGTGGGAPTTGGAVGTVTAPPVLAPPAAPAPPAPAPSPPPAPPVASGCPASFPNKGPHGCWRWSRTKTGAGCSCHGYQNGVLECEHKVGGRCTF